MKSTYKTDIFSGIRRCFKVLNKRDKQKLTRIVLFQTLLGFFDLVGVLLIGALVSVSINTAPSGNSLDFLEPLLRVLGLSNLSVSKQVTFLASAALVILVTRSVLSVIFTRKVLSYLSQRAAEISADVFSKLLGQDLLFVLSHSRQATLYFITTGVNAICLNIIAPIVVLISDGILLFVIAIGLFSLDPLTAIALFLLFGLVSFFMYFFVDKRASGLGLEFSTLNVKSNEKVIEALAAYREIVVRDRRNYYFKEIKKSRAELATIVSELNFIPYISKYLIEVTVLLGALTIASFQYALNDISQATATLAIFVAAGSRVAPGVLRIQQGLINIRSSIGQARQTLDFMESLNRFPSRELSSTDQVDFAHKGFVADIELNEVNFWYPNSNKPALSEINLRISRGTSVAIVGPSGSGKTTLIDTLLGVLTPASGTISISGNSPLNAAATWPGAISYIPQDVEVISGTLRENVCLGFPSNENADAQIMKAIRIADLQSFVDENDKGLDYIVHERGTGLSGGQRQRLGLARAVFSEPRLLVLDEATSALDAQSELAISSALLSLKGSTTVVMIAHRLSSVRNVDLVVYMENGRIIAQGNFETVRKLVPLFDVQAKLLGLQ